MAKKIVKRNGGINIDGDVASQGDLVGRDKIIQNIVVVGQFLDFTNIEGLLPSPKDLPNFTSVAEAFQSTFSDRLGTDLAKSTAIAGEILGGVLSQWQVSRSASSVLPFRQLLKDMASILVQKLQELHYWETFSEIVYDSREHLEAVWLYSLQNLWKKYPGNQDLLYGIVYRHGDGQSFFGYQHGVFAREINFDEMRHEQSRVFIAGIVIDLIRMASTVAGDTKFLDGLISLFFAGKH